MFVLPQGLSAVSGVYVEARPNTLGQSQSAMNLSRLSPKTEPKKRRAPAPPRPSAQTLTQTQTQCASALVVQVRAHALHTHTHTPQRKINSHTYTSIYWELVVCSSIQSSAKVCIPIVSRRANRPLDVLFTKRRVTYRWIKIEN